MLADDALLAKMANGGRGWLTTQRHGRRPFEALASSTYPPTHLHHPLQQVDQLGELAAVWALPCQQRPKVLFDRGVGDEAAHLCGGRGWVGGWVSNRGGGWVGGRGSER